MHRPDRDCETVKSMVTGCDLPVLGFIDGILLGIACAPARVDPQVAADGPTHLLQALRERQEADLSFDAPNALACCPRPTSGHAAAPPSPAITSRRPMVTGI